MLEFILTFQLKNSLNFRFYEDFLLLSYWIVFFNEFRGLFRWAELLVSWPSNQNVEVLFQEFKHVKKFYIV